jgi:predicted MFS family arabinose efflux permease
MFWPVVGPAVAKADLGGAGSWAAILTTGGVGSVAGGVWALSNRPRRPVFVSVLTGLLVVPQLVLLALGAATPLVAAAAFLGGFGLSSHQALWLTAFHHEVPGELHSRVASYNVLSSLVASAVGAAMAGTLGAAVGAQSALAIAAVGIATAGGLLLVVPEVRRLQLGSQNTAVEPARPPLAGST